MFLFSQEIKLSALNSKTNVDEADNDLEAAQAVINVARKKVISQVVRMNVIENIVPTLISLKHMVGNLFF